ncbi:hypothetical protein LDL48_36465 [Wangella sp. NEAU-J3]|nr:hypothetical protein [Jidongwangia harbinensis]
MAVFLTALLAALAVGTPAYAEPAVDPYQQYVDPGCLSRVEQPGVREFRDMIMSRIGGTNGGIFACSGYEHGEGRAWDWMRQAGDPNQAATVQTVLDWLLATDAAGNPHAMARRLGIGNIIWNRKSISLWTSSAKRWNDYPCDGSPGGCHTNHVHFAFSWAGARQQTTWFTTPDRPGHWYPGGQPPVAGDTAVSQSSAVINPANGNVQVYHNANGRLIETYWNATDGWVRHDLGIAITGAPSVIRNPANGNIQVYVNSGGQLAEIYWSPTDGWSGLNPLGGGITGHPYAVVNPTNQNVQVHYNANGQLAENYWTPSTGTWSGEHHLGGTVSGSPTVFVNPHNQNVQVHYNAGGQLAENYWSPADGWSGQKLLGGSIELPPGMWTPGYAALCCSVTVSRVRS